MLIDMWISCPADIQAVVPSAEYDYILALAWRAYDALYYSTQESGMKYNEQEDVGVYAAVHENHAVRSSRLSPKILVKENIRSQTLLEA